MLMHITHTCVTSTHHDGENEGKRSIQMNLHIMKWMHGESNDPQDFNGESFLLTICHCRKQKILLLVNANVTLKGLCY